MQLSWPNGSRPPFGGFWAVRGYLLEARDWLDRALTMPDRERRGAPGVRAKALHHRGNVAIDLGDYAAARRDYEGSLAIWRSLDDASGVASALNGLGLVAGFEGDYPAAQVYHTQALGLRRELDDPLGLGNSLTNLGNTLQALGEINTAETLLREALRVRQAMDDTGAVAYAHLNLADIARDKGDQVDALALLEQSLALFQQIGDQLGVAYALHTLGVVHGDAGDESRAMSLQREALALRRDIGDRRGQIECIEGIAALCLGRQPSDERLPAVRLLAATTALRDVIRAPRRPAEQRSHRCLVQGAKSATDQAQFESAWNQGLYLTLGGAVDEAETAAQAHVAPPAAFRGLTTRETEVLRLVARGLTNRQIADQLFLSPRTVQAHIYAIFRKLDVSSRSAATRFALDHDLS